MSLPEEFLRILGGSIRGFSPIFIVAVPLIIGIAIGYLIRRVLKVGIILALAALLATFLGLINLGAVAGELTGIVHKYGSVVLSYLAIAFGVIPLTVGLLIGIILGFLF